jgi:hypothetical protein
MLQLYRPLYHSRSASAYAEEMKLFRHRSYLVASFLSDRRL